MATPVGPAERDPNDPDFWDWTDDDGDVSPRARPMRVAFVCAIVLALVALVVVSVL
jgi:hypothetical protein